MRRPVDNPFTPGADAVPTVWAGRSRQIGDWESILRPRRASGIYERGRTILGEAGLGKSTLVRRIAAEARRQGDWTTDQIRIPLGTDPLKAVASALLRLADEAGLAAQRERGIKDTLSRVRSVELAGVGLSVDGGGEPAPHTALTAILVELGIAAIRRDAVVLVHIDEVQNITDGTSLSQLLIGLGDALAHQHTIEVPGGTTQAYLPIAVYLTGLPEFAEMTAARKGATFARRFDTTTLVPLDDEDLALALRPFVAEGWPVPDEHGGEARITMTPEAADAIVRLCCGEPFLFQFAGARAWYAGTGDVITLDDVETGWRDSRREAESHVERILDRLPERERQLLEVMAALPAADRSATAIAQAMGFATAAQAGPTAQRLDTVRGIIDRGKPYAFRHRAVEAYLTSDWPEI
ncbi:MAG: AAA family ATPase [Nocardioides sp.]|uniref:ATP-binding protein n=1 Tax=Nocardioides sp. TaxID=35761 RepID=UPI0039E69E9D